MSIPNFSRTELKGFDAKATLMLGLISQICFHGVNLSAGASTNWPFIRHLERTLKPKVVVQQLTLESVLTCASVCAADIACNTVAWGETENLCLISNKDSATYGINNNNIQPLSEWTVLVKVRYDVNSFVGPNGKYSLTYVEAVTFCEDMGTTIATPDDLLQARSLGYHLCACGWLSDETNGLVVQYSNQNCIPSFTTGIHKCSRQTANVYCMWATRIGQNVLQPVIGNL